MVRQLSLRADVFVDGELYSGGHYFELSALYKLIYKQSQYPSLNILAIQNKELS